VIAFHFFVFVKQRPVFSVFLLSHQPQPGWAKEKGFPDPEKPLTISFLLLKNLSVTAYNTYSTSS
jgi:hypothetical protein